MVVCYSTTVIGYEMIRGYLPVFKRKERVPLFFQLTGPLSRFTGVVVTPCASD